MEIDYYSVYDNNFGILLADHMTLDIALIFIKALLHEYYNETDIAYTIKKMPKPTECNCCEAKDSE